MFPMTSVHPAIRRCAVMVAAAGAYAAVVGCGSGGHAAGHATPSGARSAQTQAIVRELTRCIRQHGAPNFPDLTYDQRTGKVQPPPGTGKPPRSAIAACQSIAARLPAEGRTRPPTAAEMAKLRELSKCIRQHGLPDWPDPNANGAFALPPRLRQGGKSMMRTQFQACRQYFPADGLHSADGAG